MKLEAGAVGSPLIQEKYQEEMPVTRNIIIIIISWKRGRRRRKRGMRS